MATGGKDRQGRAERERVRAYQARQELHRRVGRRRSRDNVLAIVVGLVVILGAVGAQTAYFVAGPGAPEPAPSASPSTSMTPEPEGSSTPADGTTPTPTEGETPAP